MQKTSSPRTSTRLASLALLTAVASVLTAPAASAQGVSATVDAGSRASTVDVYDGAGSGKKVVGTVPNNSTVTLACHERGSYFLGGPRNALTNIWYRLPAGSYLSHALVAVTSTSPAVPLCGTGTTPTPDPVAGPTPTPTPITDPVENPGTGLVPPSPNRPKGATQTSNTGLPGQRTWGVHDIVHRLTGYYVKVGGNAHRWGDSARANGWKVVTAAEPRSIVVFSQTAARSLTGHVAWVDSVEQRADGRYLNITEMNFNGNKNFTKRYGVKHTSGMSYILVP